MGEERIMNNQKIPLQVRSNKPSQKKMGKKNGKKKMGKSKASVELPSDVEPSHLLVHSGYLHPCLEGFCPSPCMHLAQHGQTW